MELQKISEKWNFKQVKYEKCMCFYGDVMNGECHE